MRSTAFLLVTGLALASSIAPAAAGGVRYCGLYNTTDGGQQTQDCGGWGRNLHERTIWFDNRNHQGPTPQQLIQGYGGGVRGMIGGRRFGGVPQQQVTYGQPQIQTYTVQGPRHIIGYDVTCTTTHSDGRTEILPGPCRH